jgi:hypothetical protein
VYESSAAGVAGLLLLLPLAVPDDPAHAETGDQAGISVTRTVTLNSAPGSP